MAVDLEDLVEVVRAEVSAPGENLFPGATNAQWVQSMANGFWEARLHGHFAGYRESDGVVSPLPPATADLPRELQQLIVLYTGYKAVRNKLLNLKTSTRAKAGPVESEVERSAMLLTAILKDLVGKLDELKRQLLQLGITKGYYIDGLLSRDDSLGGGDSYWPA